EAGAAALWGRIRAALLAVGDTQTQVTATQEPAQQFVDLLSAALASQRAHLVTLSGERPAWAERWGWRVIEQTIWDREAGCLREKRGWTIAPGSRPIGWVVSDDEVYLQPDNAYAAAQHLASEKRESLSVGEKTLWKRLHDAGMLASVDSTEHKHLLRRKIGGHRQYVVHLYARFLDAMAPGKSGVSGDQGAGLPLPREVDLRLTREPCPSSGGAPPGEGHDTGAQPLLAPLVGHAPAPSAPETPETQAWGGQQQLQNNAGVNMDNTQYGRAIGLREKRRTMNPDVGSSSVLRQHHTEVKEERRVQNGMTGGQGRYRGEGQTKIAGSEVCPIGWEPKINEKEEDHGPGKHREVCCQEWHGEIPSPDRCRH
ncbi:MAG TPA: hypothetical protein VNL35_04970, partial [Chloroflexota bacterium]|nr:hypothetical protein [Chloroflexota bacterium]